MLNHNATGSNNEQSASNLLFIYELHHVGTCGERGLFTDCKAVFSTRMKDSRNIVYAFRYYAYVVLYSPVTRPARRSNARSSIEFVK